MNNIIIGTAGHVDHGKTCLIRALTGIDTDRLQEEKKRGITIELGFAYLDLPDGGRAGIIDVPGHEKFIKNMLAGAGGIDIAMLIVAADEGVMPQTLEHLGILSLLDIRRGVIVITKADMADPDWIELVKEDIAGHVAGTFLEHAPVQVVSAYTGQGIDELRELLFSMVAQSGEKKLRAHFRLPVDRVFIMEGFGTVVTGTLIEGELHEGDEIWVYPAKRVTRARNIQVHSKDAEIACAGQRVAVNLGGLKKNEVERGDVVAAPGSLSVSRMADVRLRLLPDAPRSVKNTARLHFYHGAREVLCKAVLLDSEELQAGQSGYAQLRFEEEMSVKAGDRFVVRFYSPLETVGGGVVLDPDPFKHKRFDEEALKALDIKENGTLSQRVEQAIWEHSRFFSPIGVAALQTGAMPDEAERAARELAEAGSVIPVEDKVYVHKNFVTDVRRRMLDLLNAYHKAEPLKPGIKREELRSKLLPDQELGHADALLNYFIEHKSIKEVRGAISINSFQVELGEELEKLQGQMEELYRAAAFAPPATDEVLNQFAKNKRAPQVLSAMVGSSVLVRADPQIYFHHACVEQALERLRAHVEQNGQITLAEFRDMLGTSRKFAVALLEHWDRQKITKKVGDYRVLA